MNRSFMLVIGALMAMMGIYMVVGTYNECRSDNYSVYACMTFAQDGSYYFLRAIGIL